jgi:hypothetical protein
MKSLLVRRRHINLDQALTAISNLGILRKDAFIMLRKAIRRAISQLRNLLSRVVTNFNQTRRNTVSALWGGRLDTHNGLDRISVETRQYLCVHALIFCLALRTNVLPRQTITRETAHQGLKRWRNWRAWLPHKISRRIFQGIRV